MSEPTSAIPAAADLDARVDALVDQIDAAAALPDPAPKRTALLDDALEQQAEAAQTEQAQAVLSEVASDLSSDAGKAMGGSAPAFPELDFSVFEPPSQADLTSTSEPEPASGEPDATAAAMAEASAPAAEIQREDVAEAVAPEATSPTPAPERTEPATKPATTAATVETNAPAPSGETGALPDIEQLDATLADHAEDVLNQVQSELAAAPAPAPTAVPAPSASPAAVATPAIAAVSPPPATTPLPAAPALQDPVPAAPAARTNTDKPATSATPAAPSGSPASAPHRDESPAAKPEPASVPAVAKPSLRERLAPVTKRVGAIALLPLLPLARAHAKLGESVRQTIGFVALMNVFLACGLWGYLLLRQPPTIAPTSEAPVLRKPGDPMPGISAPPKASAEGEGKKGEHGAESGGHGKAEAKADSSHTAKKSSGHAEAKKPAAKPDKKADKKTAAHGGH